MIYQLFQKIKQSIFLSWRDSFYDELIILCQKEETSTCSSYIWSNPIRCSFVAFEYLFSIVVRLKWFYYFYITYKVLMSQFHELKRGKYNNFTFRFYWDHKSLDNIYFTWWLNWYFALIDTFGNLKRFALWSFRTEWLVF